MRLGSWGAQLDTEALERFIDACIDLGFSHFDHADIYGHYTEEERFGRVLKRRPDLKTKLQITTKCGIRILSPNRPQHRLKSYDATAAHLVWSAENSLRELGVDQLDVFLIHRPDFLMHPHEIATAVEQLKTSGKVRAFGVSNFSPSQFEMLHHFTGKPLAMARSTSACDWGSAPALGRPLVGAAFLTTAIPPSSSGSARPSSSWAKATGRRSIRFYWPSYSNTPPASFPFWAVPKSSGSNRPGQPWKSS